MYNGALDHVWRRQQADSNWTDAQFGGRSGPVSEPDAVRFGGVGRRYV